MKNDKQNLINDAAEAVERFGEDELEEFAKKRALLKTFHDLKHGDLVEVAYRGFGMGGPSGEFRQYKVGRRRYSKKHGVERVALLKVGGPKPVRGLCAIALLRRGENVSLAEGDMGTVLIGVRAISS